jgi:hypothetical protein
MDILELLEDDDIMQYLLDVTMEIRDHVGGTHVRKSSIEKELLDVLDFARKLGVICIFEHLFFQMCYREI